MSNFILFVDFKLLVTTTLFFFFSNTILSDSNLCSPVSAYETTLPNSQFEIININISMKNNLLSMNNSKNIRSTIALSKSSSSRKQFKILTINR